MPLSIRIVIVASGSGISRGEDIQHHGLRQVAPVETDQLPVQQDIVIPQPKNTSDYFAVNDLIDRHNRQRQDDLQLEKKIECKRWDMQMGCGFLGMICVDTKLTYECSTLIQMSPGQFYIALAEALIGNKYVLPDSVCWSSHHQSQQSNENSVANSSASSIGTSGVGLHLTLLKRRCWVTLSNGEKVQRTAQLHCKECSKKTIRVCSECTADPDTKDSGVGWCNPANG